MASEDEEVAEGLEQREAAVTCRVWSSSHHAHVHHLAPAMVVPVGGVVVLVVVRALDGELRIVWVVGVELELALQG